MSIRISARRVTDKLSHFFLLEIALVERNWQWGCAGAVHYACRSTGHHAKQVIDCIKGPPDTVSDFFRGVGCGGTYVPQMQAERHSRTNSVSTKLPGSVESGIRIVSVYDSYVEHTCLSGPWLAGKMTLDLQPVFAGDLDDQKADHSY